MEARRREICKLILIGILVSIAVNIILGLTFTSLLSYDPSKSDTYIDDLSIVKKILLIVILAPLIETFLFQYLLIRPFLKKKSKKIMMLGIFISALVFGLMHYFNIYYIVTMFVIGLIFGIFFVLGQTKFNRGFIVVFSIHSFMNGLSMILEEFNP